MGRFGPELLEIALGQRNDAHDLVGLNPSCQGADLASQHTLLQPVGGICPGTGLTSQIVCVASLRRD